MTTDFIGRGWAFPVTVRDSGGIATVGGVANLEKAMRIVLATQLGERPMRPAFGSRLREHLFAGISPETLRAIEDEVRRAITSCEPRARVDGVTATAEDARRGRVDIEIRYTVLATNDPHNLVVPFYAIPGEEE
jgi:phage baseplate assembly protein W